MGNLLEMIVRKRLMIRNIHKIIKNRWLIFVAKRLGRSFQYKLLEEFQGSEGPKNLTPICLTKMKCFLTFSKYFFYQNIFSI
jgi:hypothetical protein